MGIPFLGGWGIAEVVRKKKKRGGGGGELSWRESEDCQ